MTFQLESVQSTQTCSCQPAPMFRLASNTSETKRRFKLWKVCPKPTYFRIQLEAKIWQPYIPSLANKSPAAEAYFQVIHLDKEYLELHAKETIDDQNLS